MGRKHTHTHTHTVLRTTEAYLSALFILQLFLFLFFNLTYSQWISSLPSCLWSQRISPSLPGSRLTIFLSRCKFSTLTTRQPMVELCSEKENKWQSVRTRKPQRNIESPYENQCPFQEYATYARNFSRCYRYLVRIYLNYLKYSTRSFSSFCTEAREVFARRRVRIILSLSLLPLSLNLR